MQHDQQRSSEWAATAAAAVRTGDLRTVVRRLGARVIGRTGDHCTVAFGFWLPQAESAVLRIYRPLHAVDPGARMSEALFSLHEIPLAIDGGFGWAVVDGVRDGNRDRLGDMYRVRVSDCETEPPRIHHDPLASSVPFGAAAPAEVYDIERLWEQRSDTDYLRRAAAAAEPDATLGVPRLPAPTNILQIHVPTATREGTFAGLSRVYRRLARKLTADEPLSPLEHCLSEYDAVQLMPVEPIIEYEGGDGFWHELQQPRQSGGAAGQTVRVQLRRPDMTNWGYDVMTVASPAVNPVLLERGRPEEFVEFLETLHGMPGGGIKVIFDIVYGHADNQSEDLLPPQFIAGPGMYGLVFDYRRPEVREILLEMQRRKSMYGIDGLRVDGAQDFKYYDAERSVLVHDDDYLVEMNNQVLEIAGTRYLPWMIFEDGRPWPQDDWELSSTYLEVTRRLPNVYQWGPLTFAHNTPFLYTFWAQKWWRVREVFRHGANWITGCSNHDTLRRGTQVDPEERINNRLGADYREVFRNAYNNPGVQLLTYGVMPGVPMDFLQANVRAPWSFIRNTDDRWAVKVVSEESRFLIWAVDEAMYGRDGSFVRLKGYGFQTLEQLRGFMRQLDLAMRAADYHRETAAAILDAALPSSPLAPHRISNLKSFARAWMDDVHDYCNIANWSGDIDAELALFHARTRAFRRGRPYLRRSLDPAHERFAYLEPCDGSVVYAVLRRDPAGGEHILALVNMEGRERPVELHDVLLLLDRQALTKLSWKVALATPGQPTLSAGSACPQRLELGNSAGLLATAAGPR